MAMDALKNLTTNVPNWLTRLDVLSTQVDQRQVELASIAAAEKTSGETKSLRSLRNKGSQESLKPQDDGPSNIQAPEELQSTEEPTQPEPADEQPSEPKTSVLPTQDVQTARIASASPGAGCIASLHKPQRDTVAAAHSRAKAQVRKRVRSTSMASAAEAPQPYRTRSMIIVYYDSYVQGFFDDLVRFISSSRNMIRKAKMAARVAQIKKMAEIEVSNGDSAGSTDGNGPLPSLRYMSARRMGPMTTIGRLGFTPPGSNEEPDAYDKLDKSLEFVQGTCEHGAHQFLRDADCNEEIKKIQQRLEEVIEMAKKEMERVELEEPELVKATPEVIRPRSLRPISIRRELSGSAKEMAAAAREDAPKLGAARSARSARSKSSFIEPASHPLEADTDIGLEDPIDIELELPKLQYRSTRAMRQWRA